MAKTARRALNRLERPTSAAPLSPPDETSTTSMYQWAQRTRPNPRPHYVWGTFHAARVGRALGFEEVSVLEFGVAGGNGLLALEQAAVVAEELTGVRISVWGFDTGTGMPPPCDERDIPWAIQPGILPMDESALRRRLERAELVLGPVERTVREWIGHQGAPVGFAAFDLDLYSATVAALGLFDGPESGLLPRVACYFDDIFGYAWNDFTGALAAIADFNADHERTKVAAIRGLRYELGEEDRDRPWPEQMYLAHSFDSSLYNRTEWTIPPSWVAAHRLQGGQS